MMYPVKKLIRIDEAMNDGIDALARRQQTPVLTVTDAIRALICAWAGGTAEAPPEAEGGWNIIGRKERPQATRWSAAEWIDPIAVIGSSAPDSCRGDPDEGRNGHKRTCVPRQSRDPSIDLSA
jgi:hypothetical protein